ncbi:GGDEF domain-containing protein [Desulfosediminicola ganghwensis]|uniref:GGDEF domain-containing protein n=1 Tax=Desulfosediminicola ganghwensis TaxID=2569540 RepID=UPI0010AB5396|nr:diguanylate cyclase [Desulfosediminicola ganghwensis]
MDRCTEWPARRSPRWSSPTGCPSRTATEATVEEHEIKLSDGTTSDVTISAGVATWTSDFNNQDQLIKAADKALYSAKQNGRNRVEPTGTQQP